MAVTQLKDGRWCVYGRPGYFPGNHKKRREYFGRGAMAEKRARARDAEISCQRTNLPPPGPTFYQLATEYAACSKMRQSSFVDLAARLKKSILPAIGHKQAIRLTGADLDIYTTARRTHKTRRGTYVKSSTVRRDIVIIKAILNWSCKQSPPLLAFNPIAGYKLPPSDDDVFLPPTAQEAGRIYAEASEHLRRAIVLSWYLGLRPGAVELLTLTWELSVQAPALPAAWDSKTVRADKYQHIDTGQGIGPLGVIRIRSAHKGGPRLRDVPIHPDLFSHLRRWHEADGGKGPLIHYRGGPIKNIHKGWRGAKKRAGITRRIRPYDLRHHFATQALESGADVGALSDIMGSSAETLRRHYQHVSRELTRRTVELIPALGVGDTKARITKQAAVKPRQGSADKG